MDLGAVLFLVRKGPLGGGGSVREPSGAWCVRICEAIRANLAGVSRGNTIRGNTTRNSERKMALWEGLWEGLWKTSENL